MKRIAWIVMIASFLTVVVVTGLNAESVNRYFKYSGTADFECVMEVVDGQFEPKECVITFK